MPLASALAAPAGGVVAVPSLATRQLPSPFAGISLPYQKGILAETPLPDVWAGAAAVRMQPVVDPSIGGVLVDGDENANSLDKAAGEFLDTVAGFPIAGDTGPLGSRAHIVPDSSDAALNLTGQDRGIGIGMVGTSPQCISGWVRPAPRRPTRRSSPTSSRRRCWTR